MFFSQSMIVVAAVSFAAAQTYTSCNPLTSSSCPADTALGKSISVDFTQGAVNSFTASGSPTYDSNGVSFTVAKSGDAPSLTSIFYIMFGKVEVTMKAAPGAGIVSTLVLESDDLDEIDMEWLGSDSTEVQTNYFGKGMVTDYNRGAFNPAANNQGEFIKYTIEWTSTQVVWQVGGVTVRVLTPESADTNQYPQTPMKVKFGAWAGGDPSNPAGTIAWARGPTDYSQGPFTMVVQSVDVTDYSTGTEYSYSGTSGDWQDIVAAGGSVNGNLDSSATAVASADVPAITSASPSIPVGIGAETGWPWVATQTSFSTVTWSTSASIPSGWIISSSGKIVPANSAATPSPTSIQFFSVDPSLSSSLQASQGVGSAGLETITGWDDRGFPTTKTVAAGWETESKSYDQQGFIITSSPTTEATGTLGLLTATGDDAAGRVVKSTNIAVPGRIQASSTYLGLMLGMLGLVL